MTGALVHDIWKSALYAASVAPRLNLYPLYWLLGVLAAFAYRLGAWFPLRRRKAPKDQRCTLSPPPQSKEPRLIIVIPAFAKTIEEVAELQSAVHVISRSNFQTIIIDDGSPIDLNLTGCKVVRHARNLGPAAARNTGMQHALKYGASSIAFTDADCHPSPDWAAAHAKLQESSPGIWAGRTLAYDRGLVSQFYNDVGTLMPRLKDGRRQEAIYAPTCNLSISAEIARKLKFDAGFPTSAFEDCDFCVRARNLGYKVRVSKTPVVKHRFKNGVLGLVNSYFKYGRSFPIMLAKHPMYKSMLGSSHPMSIMTWREC